MTAWLVIGDNVIEVVVDSPNWVMEVETSSLRVGAVPLPAAGALFASALAWLGALARRQSQPNRRAAR